MDARFSKQQLLVEPSAEPSLIHFRDEFDEAGKEQKCDVLLAVGVVITAGFRNTME